MADDTLLTDDYVAEIMAREANDASMKYSALGLEAFRSSKPANKAKPNTRFLRTIIKETKNHNEALLAKEAAESQARLSDLKASEEQKRRKLRPSADDMRKRQLGNIASILSGGKRKRDVQDDDRPAAKGASGSDVREDGSSPKDRRSRRKNRRDSRDRRRHYHKHSREEDKHTGRLDRYSLRSRSRSWSRSRSPEFRERRHRHRHRSPLTEDEEESRPRRRKDYEDDRNNGDLLGRALSKRIKRGRLAEPEESTDASSRRAIVMKVDNDNDSDPLEDFIGPAPPTEFRIRGQARGRGATSGPSAMDRRFSETYDPRVDAQPDLDEADSDEAIEAFRDRQKWKQQGADRLRAAGFTNEQVRKWEKGGEKDIDDVRWVGAGQRREWDKGKDMNRDVIL